MKKNVGIWLFIVLVLAGAAGYIFFQKPDTEQELKKIAIGIINPNPGSKGLNKAFINELQRYASLEGWQLAFHMCDKKDSFDEDLKKLVSLHPDLIFMVTTPGTKKAQKAFKGTNVPGVFILFDPVKAGIIDSLSQPGGNFTGIKLRGSVPKALEWLQSVDPSINNIFVPVKFDTKSATMSMGDLKKAANLLGLKLNVAEVNSKEELHAALESIPEEADAIFLLNSILISTNAQIIVQASIRHKLPTAASIGKDEEGVLLTYSTQHSISGKQASRMAYMILKGQNPAEIPAEIADFHLIINLSTAEKIGMKVPDSILTQADKILRHQK